MKLETLATAESFQIDLKMHDNLLSRSALRRLQLLD